MQDNNHFPDLINDLQYLNAHIIKAGITEEAGTNAEGVNIAQYAAYNEYGTKHIPARPFIGSTADEQRRDWNALQDRLIDGIYNRRVHPQKALTRMGKKAMDDIKHKIKVIQNPPNAPSTVRQKGSSNPLIENSTMRQAIRYEVERD